MSIHTVISISRQFGSGGREIGRGLAEACEIPFYDSALITMAAEKSGMSKQVLENLDEKAA
ncbi:MAG: cytidylate kinase family protein, partial [Sphaerochaetaceae bacterium]|nr:cytidylate kinase family protein [Sphaerochaetaceae bacterium]